MLETITSAQLKVTGLIGHAVSLNKKSTSVGETECGIGNTCSWKMPGIDPQSSYGIYFEIANQAGQTSHPQGQGKGLIQFLTYYQCEFNLPQYPLSNGHGLTKSQRLMEAFISEYQLWLATSVVLQGTRASLSLLTRRLRLF